jgi:hypothetical protein
MISQTDIQGAILVDFSKNNYEYDYNLWEEKFVIIEGIAHQTAVAVENIKLIQSQEEDAYVSVALLQVAQAIVSATEIDDVLSVITRIFNPGSDETVRNIPLDFHRKVYVLLNLMVSRVQNWLKFNSLPNLHFWKASEKATKFHVI